MNKLSGLIAAPHTPFAADGSVNYPVIDDIAKHLITTGVTGAYVLGTTGEGIHCSVEERKKVAERWVTASQGQLAQSGDTGRDSEDDRQACRHWRRGPGGRSGNQGSAKAARRQGQERSEQGEQHARAQAQGHR